MYFIELVSSELFVSVAKIQHFFETKKKNKSFLLLS